MRQKRWSNDDLKEAVLSSTSYRQVLIKLKLKVTGGNFQNIKSEITNQGISTNQFRGKGWNKGLTGFTSPRKIPLKDILIKDSKYQSNKLRTRLLKEGLKKLYCEECKWSERSTDGRIPLELHHKNGNKNDNRLTNLQILCPNCHSLKENHRGKNIKRAGML